MKTKLLLVLSCLLTFAGQAQNWGHVGPLSNNTPGNLFHSGRIDCIMLDPGFNAMRNQTIYTGSISGGLWKTSDMGQNWNNIQIPNTVLYHGISALEYSPSGTVLAATCNAMGIQIHAGTIYQVNIGTNTWTPSFLSSVVSGAYIKDIAIFPNDPTIVFAATDQGLFRSTDSGMNWALVLAGNFERVAFMELLAAQGGYRVFVCGANDIEYSTDKGITFSQHTGLMSMLPAGFYADMAATYDASNTNIQYLYVDGMKMDASDMGTHKIVRLQLDKNGGFEVFVASSGVMADSYPVGTGRMSAAAFDQMFYFGCNGIGKWAVSGGAGTFLVPSYNGSDYMGTTIPYGWAPVHGDHHDLVIHPSTNLLFLATDGGFGYNNYAPTSNGWCVNSWAKRNNGLHISQIWGLGISDQDSSKFFTGEQDNQAYLSVTNSTTFGAMGNEPSNVIMDKFNSNNYLYRNNSAIGQFNGVSVNINSQDHWDGTGTSFCNPDNSIAFPEPEWGWNTFFQDPNREGHIYHGEMGPGLDEICFSASKHIVKASFPGSWYQFVNGMAFSKENKNKVYVSISNRMPPAQGRPKVFVYSGVDFDDSWAGHNSSWTELTPANNDAVYTTPLNTSNEHLMESVGIVSSDWNADNIWWAVRNVPGNPNLKVLKRNGSFWSDYSQGIPSSEYPVSLVYEQGSNDQMYLGTNVNVYYRNATMSSWQPYSGTLPNTCMQQLRINYGDNTLNVGTYGRGVWKSDLQCPPNVSVLENQPTINDKFVEASGNITGSGTISWGDVKYRAGDYIDLLPGFYVITGYGTRFYGFIHGCANHGNTFRKPQSDEDYEMLEMMTKDELKGEREPRMQIMPNPGTGLFYLERESTGEARIMVYDLKGHCVLDKPNVNTQREAIDLSENPNGLYLVRIITSERVESFRIVKQ